MSLLAGFMPHLPPAPRAAPPAIDGGPIPRELRCGREKGRVPKDWYGWISPSGMLRAVWRGRWAGAEGFLWLFQCLRCGSLVERLPRRLAQGDVQTCGCGSRGGGERGRERRRLERERILKSQELGHGA